MRRHNSDSLYYRVHTKIAFFGCPAGRFVGMTGVRGMQMLGLIGTWYSETVIASGIHAYIGFIGHMAIGAQAASLVWFVEVVLCTVVFCVAVALSAQGIVQLAER